MTKSRTRFSATAVSAEELQEARYFVDVEEGVITVPTAPSDVAPASQDIGFSYAKPYHRRNGMPKILFTMQWSEYASREPQKDRARSVAHIVGADVLSLDMPGQSPNSDGTTRLQKEGLRKGDYSEIAKALWCVAEKVFESEDEDIAKSEIILAGPSQGGAIASAMAANKPTDVEISDVVLINSASVANYDDRSWQALGINFLQAGTDQKYYHESNPGWAYRESAKDFLRIAANPRGHLFLPIKALARSRDWETLFDTLRRRELGEARIHLVHSELDIVSRVEDNLQAAEYLSRHAFGGVRRRELAGEYHGITGHLGSLATIFTEVVKATA